MDKNEFAPRNIAKGVVKSIVAIKTSQFAKNQITDYTRFEEDDMIVKISTGIIGGYVASRLSPRHGLRRGQDRRLRGCQVARPQGQEERQARRQEVSQSEDPETWVLIFPSTKGGPWTRPTAPTCWIRATAGSPHTVFRFTRPYSTARNIGAVRRTFRSPSYRTCTTPLHIWSSPKRSREKHGL
jgi:hypothetical protein